MDEILTRQYRKRLGSTPLGRLRRPCCRRRRIRGALMYARGTVRHPDHATVELRGYHRVVPNTEEQPEARQHLVFVD